jgi:hypothetical protein
MMREVIFSVIRIILLCHHELSEQSTQLIDLFRYQEGAATLTIDPFFRRFFNTHGVGRFSCFTWNGHLGKIFYVWQRIDRACIRVYSEMKMGRSQLRISCIAYSSQMRTLSYCLPGSHELLVKMSIIVVKI